MQAVTFDMDGLMFNSEDIYTLAGTELLARRGIKFTPELKDAMMGLPPQRAFEAMIAIHALGEPWHALAAESDENLPRTVERASCNDAGLDGTAGRAGAGGHPQGDCHQQTRGG